MDISELSNLKNKEEVNDLRGWVDTIRHHGGLMFFELRDHETKVQIVTDNPEQFDNLKNEFYVSVAGILVKRKKENQNLNKLRINIPLEIKLKKEIEPKYNYQIVDPSEITNLTNFFEKGSLAMVKSGERNSSSTEFFFVTNKFPELDGRYSIFGKVVKGIEILQEIDKEDLIYEIIISN